MSESKRVKSSNADALTWRCMYDSESCVYNVYVYIFIYIYIYIYFFFNV